MSRGRRPIRLDFEEVLVLNAWKVPVAKSRLSDGRSAGASWDLYLSLVSRDLKGRYRGSYLGWLWSLIRPLVMLAIYGLIIGVFLGAARSIPDFMIFIYVSLLAWTVFTSTIMAAIGSVSSAASLITKNSFNRLLLPLAAFTGAMVDVAIQGAVLVVGYLFLNEWPTGQSLLYLAPSLSGLALLGLGLGLILSAVNVYVRDTKFMVDVALQVGFWLCPIFYSYALIEQAAISYGWSVEWVTRIYMLNPVANGVFGFQRALWPPAASTEGAAFVFPGQLEVRLVVLALLGAIVCVVGVLTFRRLSRNFAQEM